MPEPRSAELHRELAAHYSLCRIPCAVGNRPVQITAVEDPNVLLDELIERDPNHPDVRDERLPYWAWLWPAAKALADIVVDELTPDDDVLELGCGLGLVAIAALFAGARVTATDYQKDALLFTELNCRQNGLPAPQTALLDWREPDLDRRFDCILAADVAYEERFFQPLLNCLKDLLAEDGKVLLGEPNRAIAGPFFTALENDGWKLQVLAQSRAATCYRLLRC